MLVLFTEFWGISPPGYAARAWSENTFQSIV